MATQPIIAEKEVNRGFVFALMELQYYDYCSIEFMSSNGMSIEDLSKMYSQMERKIVACIETGNCIGLWKLMNDKVPKYTKVAGLHHVDVVKHLFKNVSEIDIKELKRNMVSQDTGMLTADYRPLRLMCSSK